MPSLLAGSQPRHMFKTTGFTEPSCLSKRGAAAQPRPEIGFQQLRRIRAKPARLMANFSSCIVSLLDLNDLMTHRGPKGSVMRELHQLVANCAPNLKAHEEVCFWQDAVLLLALVNPSMLAHRRVMKDVAKLKAAIDEFHPCHAVSVKGKAFPAPEVHHSPSRPRTVYLAASSWAFANCFRIETKLRKRRADWYIDSPIKRKIRMRAADHIDSIRLLPRKELREVHVFHGSFE
jgi:hypothetical protein